MHFCISAKHVSVRVHDFFNDTDHGLLHCELRLPVTTSNRVNHALELLREEDNDVDLVISDVYMPGEDGFKLLEVIGLELDLPVISKHSLPSIFFQNMESFIMPIHTTLHYAYRPYK